MATATYTANPWQFAGAFYDSTTGLYKFGIRYYDPTLGRWTQQDPLGGSLFDPSTGNRYAYTNDDPTNLTDPTGKDTQSGFVNCLEGAATFTIGWIGTWAATAIAATFVAGAAAVPIGVGILVGVASVGCVIGVVTPIIFQGIEGLFNN